MRTQKERKHIILLRVFHQILKLNDQLLAFYIYQFTIWLNVSDVVHAKKFNYRGSTNKVPLTLQYFAVLSR